MKRLLKVFAFIGGIGAVGWLLQNRIVTVTMSREPKAPELAPEPETGSPASSEPRFTAEGRAGIGREGATPEPEHESATAAPAEEAAEHRPPDEE